MHSASDAVAGGTANVTAIMRRIRDDLRGVDREHDWKRQARKAVPPGLISSVQRLRSSTAMLRSSIARIGEPPPSPPTLRGRVGLQAVQAVRRTLFWLVPSIQTAQNQIVDALDQHLAATEQILHILQQTNVELARLSHVPAAASQTEAGPRR